MTTPQTNPQVAWAAGHLDPNTGLPEGSVLAQPNPTNRPNPPSATRVALRADDQSRTPRRPSKVRRTALALYYYLHFKFPHLYFSRVHRVFALARLSEEDLRQLMMLNGPTSALVKAGIATTGILWLRTIEEGWIRYPNAITPKLGTILLPPLDDTRLPPQNNGREPQAPTTPVRTPGAQQWWPTEGLKAFETEWTAFIDAASREWKTLNIVSALLLSAALTLLQIDAARSQAVTRTFVFLSLSSALISLILGCSYILKFSTMKTLRKAAHWVKHSQDNQDSHLWNIWILLSLPAVWLTWSGIEFCVAILSLLWTMGPSTNADGPTGDIPTSSGPLPVTPGNSLTHPDTIVPRVVVTLEFFVGFIHGVMMVKTFLAWTQIGARLGFTHRPRAQTNTSSATRNNEVRPENVNAPLPPNQASLPNQQPTSMVPQLSTPKRQAKVLPEDDWKEGIQMEDMGGYFGGPNKAQVDGLEQVN